MVELSLVEFPADDPERARRFWEGLLEVSFAEREEGRDAAGRRGKAKLRSGCTSAGQGPATFSLPYFAVPDVGEALARVEGTCFRGS